MVDNYDCHTLYVTTGVASKEQLAHSLLETKRLAEEILQQDIPCEFQINVIVGRNGQYYGVGYVRVSNPIMYWILVGRNPDGSERVETIPDPDWDPGEGEGEDDEESSDDFGEWAEVKEKEDHKVRPMITRELGPLVNVPGYRYDEDQLSHFRAIAEERGEDADQIDEVGHFIIQRGHFKHVGSNKLANVLFARKTPPWIGEQMDKLKADMSRYCTGPPNKKIYMRVKGKVIDGPAPLIHVDNDTVYVGFDPDGNDGPFAKFMVTKYVFNRGVRNESRMVFFDYSYAHGDVDISTKNIKIPDQRSRKSDRGRQGGRDGQGGSGGRNGRRNGGGSGGRNGSGGRHSGGGSRGGRSGSSGRDGRQGRGRRW